MRIPSHRRRVDGRGVVTLSGVDYYTGRFDSPQAKAKYDRLVSEYLASGRHVVQPGSGKTVAEIVAAYIAAGQNTDRRDGRAIPHLLALYGESSADAFGPLAFKAVRARMMGENWTRQDVNLCMLRVRKVFRFAVENQMLPASVVQALNCVTGLKRGQHREGKKVVAVDEVAFRRAIMFLPFPLRAVAELQWLTGARAGELLRLKSSDVDRTGEVWVYRPTEHKTANKGHIRIIHFGPQSQQILLSFLDRPQSQLCFRPCDVRADHGPHYSVSQYGALIRHACKRANVERWHSHQLRHAAGTRIRRDFGVDAAQAMLGHRHMNMTEHYSPPALEKAADAARRAG